MGHRKTSGRLIDDGLLNWLHGYAYKNRWRVCNWIGMDDLLQDGYFLIYILRHRYPTIRTAPHFMAIFKRCYSNYITDLSRKRTRLAEMPLSDLCVGMEEEMDALARIFGGISELATIKLVYADAPRSVKAVLDLFLGDDSKLVQLEKSTVRPGHPRQTYNQKICQIIGIDSSGINIVQATQDYLTSVNEINFLEKRNALA